MSEEDDRRAKNRALARADFIRDRIETVVEFWEAVVEAYQQRDWEVLEYESWDAYIDGEFGSDRIRLTKKRRQGIVSEMRQRGMSTRAIGSALGVSQKTVDRDVDEVESDDSPESVIGTDGKTYSAAKAEPRETSCGTDNSFNEALAQAKRWLDTITRGKLSESERQEAISVLRKVLARLEKDKDG